MYWSQKPPNPLVKETVICTSWFPQHVDGLRSRRVILSFFGLEIPLSSFSFLLRSNSSQVACPRSLRAFGSPVLTCAPLWLQERSQRYPQSRFASDLSITQRPRVSSDPLHKDRHTFTQSSLSSCRNAKRMETFPSFPRDSAFINAEPLFMQNFQPEVVGFCSGNSSRLNFGSPGGAFFFFQQMSLPDI